MSCDTNTHKVTVLGNLDMDHTYRGRHWKDDDHDHVGLKDLIEANRESEAHRDIIREVLEAKFAGVRETVEAKAAVLQAVERAAAEVKEAKHDLVVKILENRAEDEKGKREQLRDLFDLFGKRRDRCGGHD